MEFRLHCHDYYMEVITTLCFGGKIPPEPGLIKMLMNLMISGGRATTRGPDEVPVITSSLFQLLLDHK